MKKEEILQEFAGKFRMKFNIGVVPDDMTYADIIDFIKWALDQYEPKPLDEKIILKLKEIVRRGNNE